MSTTRQKTKRQRLIQLIHVGKNKLNLKDDDYRNLLLGITNKDSCSNMNNFELEKVLKAIKSLGFEIKRLPLKESDIGAKASKEQLLYIKGLWSLVARVKTEKALSAFVNRLTGSPFLRWLTVKDAQKVILALREMAVKAGYNPDTLE